MGWSVLQAGFGVAPGPAIVAVVAPRAGALAGRIGQRPILVVGGILYALGGLYRVVALGPQVDYVGDYLPSMLLTGLGVAFVFPQLSTDLADALAGYERIWWLIVAGGLLTSLLVLPLRTRATARPPVVVTPAATPTA